MNNEGKFWVATWAVCGVVFLGFFLIVSGYYMDKNAKITEMVKSGVSPVEAVCALSDDYGNNPTCVVLAAKK